MLGCQIIRQCGLKETGMLKVERWIEAINAVMTIINACP
jgi:hypothetical protein